MTGGSTLRQWWPILVMAAGVIGSASVGQFQIGANAEEIKDNAHLIEENEDAIELIQRQLIQRQGEVEIRTQRIEIEQQEQSETLNEILLLLRQIRDPR